jgi:hypothetical protein
LTCIVSARHVGARNTSGDAAPSRFLPLHPNAWDFGLLW